MCGKLKKVMYGTRGAAQNWELEYTDMMVEAGVTCVVFYQKEKLVLLGFVKLCNVAWM